MQLRLNSADDPIAGTPERVTEGDAEYLKTPVAASREQILAYEDTPNAHDRELLPGDELSAGAARTNTVTTTLNHPLVASASGGIQTCLTSTPGAQYASVGDFRNLRMNGSDTKLLGELWLPVDERDDHGAEYREAFDTLEDGGEVGVSLGYAPGAVDPTPGRYNGERYDAVQRAPEIDHLALITSGKPRCSVEAGCAAGRANAEPIEAAVGTPVVTDGGAATDDSLMSNQQYPEQDTGRIAGAIRTLGSAFGIDIGTRSNADPEPAPDSPADAATAIGDVPTTGTEWGDLLWKELFNRLVFAQHDVPVFGKAAAELNETRQNADWNPVDHPRDPVTGRFITRPFSVPKAIRELSTVDAIQQLAHEDPDFASKVDGLSIDLPHDEERAFDDVVADAVAATDGRDPATAPHSWDHATNDAGDDIWETPGESGARFTLAENDDGTYDLSAESTDPTTISQATLASNVDREEATDALDEYLSEFDDPEEIDDALLEKPSGFKRALDSRKRAREKERTRQRTRDRQREKAQTERERRREEEAAAEADGTSDDDSEDSDTGGDSEPLPDDLTTLEFGGMASARKTDSGKSVSGAKANRWQKYGKDRIYFNGVGRDRDKLFLDLKTGEVVGTGPKYNRVSDSKLSRENDKLVAEFDRGGKPYRFEIGLGGRDGDTTDGGAKTSLSQFEDAVGGLSLPGQPNQRVVDTDMHDGRLAVEHTGGAAMSMELKERAEKDGFERVGKLTGEQAEKAGVMSDGNGIDVFRPVGAGGSSSASSASAVPLISPTSEDDITTDKVWESGSGEGHTINARVTVTDPESGEKAHLKLRNAVDIGFQVSGTDKRSRRILEENPELRGFVREHSQIPTGHRQSPGDRGYGGYAGARGSRGRFNAASKTVAGVTFTTTKGGTLDESKIDSEDFASHYLVAGETKSDSSYPVVDADGALRRGNVESAWNLRGGGDAAKSDLEDKLKKLAGEFDDDPLPDDTDRENATEYDEGDVVEYDDEGHIGVVLEVRTDDFKLPVGEEDEREVPASADDPVYLVARETQGFGEFAASDLSSGEFPDDVPGGDPEELKNLEDGDSADDRENAEKNPWVGFRPGEPEGWTRKSYLQAYASLGASWTSCVAQMRDDVSRPKRWCAALKDEVWQSERAARMNAERIDSDETAESVSGADVDTSQDTMQDPETPDDPTDEQKIDYLVDEANLDRENMEPLAGTDCLGDIYQRFNSASESEDGGETETETSESAETTDTPGNEENAESTDDGPALTFESESDFHEAVGDVIEQRENAKEQESLIDWIDSRSERYNAEMLDGTPAGVLEEIADDVAGESRENAADLFGGGSQPPQAQADRGPMRTDGPVRVNADAGEDGPDAAVGGDPWGNGGSRENADTEQEADD